MPDRLQAANDALLNVGKCAEDIAWILIEGITEDVATTSHAHALKKKAGLDGDQFERLLLWHAVRQALPRLASLPVDDSVRLRLEQDLLQLHVSKASMEIGSNNFSRAAKMATLRRFPAGAMEWEVSGIPRSLFLQMPFPANVRCLSFVLCHLGGREPCFFMHVPPSPRNRAMSIPKEVNRAYYRIVRSMQLQPAVRALLACAWFHDPAAVRDYPHLDVLNEPFVRHGGLITLLGTAPADSGVQAGNAQRRADYLAGKIHYKYGFGIWPRDAAIRWADAHSELGE